MPYKSESIKLKGLQDRRRKLTDDDKELIRKIYAEGNSSSRALAEQFGVSKSLILILVNPEREKAVKERIKEHWRDYKPTKEKRAETVREHRRYKQELYLKGELRDDSNN